MTQAFKPTADESDYMRYYYHWGLNYSFMNKYPNFAKLCSEFYDTNAISFDEFIYRYAYFELEKYGLKSYPMNDVEKKLTRMILSDTVMSIQKLCSEGLFSTKKGSLLFD